MLFHKSFINDSLLFGGPKFGGGYFEHASYVNVSSNVSILGKVSEGLHWIESTLFTGGIFKPSKPLYSTDERWSPREPTNPGPSSSLIIIRLSTSVRG